MEKYLTHKEVEHLCDEFMASHKWERVKVSQISSSPQILVDRIYMQENEVPLGFEIKPENILNEEVKMGMGELACLAPFQIKPYLVIPQVKFELFEHIFAKHPWVGVLTYLPRRGVLTDLPLTIRKKPILSDNLIFLDLPLPPKALTKEFVQSAIREFQIWGMCPASVLVERLRDYYPNYKYSSRHMGVLLTEMGLKHTDGGYIIPEKMVRALDGEEIARDGGRSGGIRSTRSTVPTPPFKKQTAQKICPQCGAPLRLQFLRKGAFYSCSNYPDCTFTMRPTPRYTSKR